MHTGPYDGEPATIDAMRAFAAEQGYAHDYRTGTVHYSLASALQHKRFLQAQIARSRERGVRVEHD